RSRPRGDLAGDRDPARTAVGSPPVVSRGEGGRCPRARRSLAAAALARAPPLVGLRRPARLVPARWLLRHPRPGARLWGAAAVGVPHGAALDRVRADL